MVLVTLYPASTERSETRRRSNFSHTTTDKRQNNIIIILIQTIPHTRLSSYTKSLQLTNFIFLETIPLL